MTPTASTAMSATMPHRRYGRPRGADPRGSPRTSQLLPFPDSRSPRGGTSAHAHSVTEENGEGRRSVTGKSGGSDAPGARTGSGPSRPGTGRRSRRRYLSRHVRRVRHDAASRPAGRRGRRRGGCGGTTTRGSCASCRAGPGRPARTSRPRPGCSLRQPEDLPGRRRSTSVRGCSPIAASPRRLAAHDEASPRDRHTRRPRRTGRGRRPRGQALDGRHRSALTLIGQLPDDQAEVVLSACSEASTRARVAGIVGKRAGTVRVLQHRGLRRLAELLGSEARTGEEVVR